MNTKIDIFLDEEKLDSLFINFESWMDEIDKDSLCSEKSILWASNHGYSYDDLYWEYSK